MTKIRWIFLVLVCMLLYSYTASSEHHIYTEAENQGACGDLCTKNKLDYYDFYEILSEDGSGKIIQNCECLDKEAPAT